MLLKNYIYYSGATSMYELQNINQNILSDFLEQLTYTLKNKNIIYLTKAVEYAIRKELPNTPQYMITPIIQNISKKFEQGIDIKISKFNSEKEAQDLFKNIYSEQLNLAGSNNCTQEISDLIYAAYDLCKYDKKITIKGHDCLFNSIYLLSNQRLHQKAYNKWERENEIKPNEYNINISHNQSTTTKNQLKFVKDAYKLYNNNPYSYNLEKEFELGIIKGFEEDNYMMARAISEIKNVNYKMQNIKDTNYNTMLKSYKNISPYLNSSTTIHKKDIINSWLTHIAFLYIEINPQRIPKTKLSRYITTVSNATTIYKKDKEIISAEQLRNAKFRETDKYNNLRLLEITDNRRKIKYCEETTKTTENYLKNITHYLNKFSH